ncbi:MAG: type I restriction/modification system N-6 DNA methyltransferase, partial [uncultured bacterium]
MPTQKINKAIEIINKVFENKQIAYGLKEFGAVDFEKALVITEEEKNKFYLKDKKSGKLKLIYDENKKTGRPEEIIRQLWLYKLRTHYQYPLDRIDTEKSIHFGREIHAKAADIIVYKKDKITPYIIIEIKTP